MNDNKPMPLYTQDEVVQAHRAAIRAARQAWMIQLKDPSDGSAVAHLAQGYGHLHLRIGTRNRRTTRLLIPLLSFVAKDTSRKGERTAHLPGGWRGGFQCRLAAHKAYAQAISQSLGVSVSVQTYQ